jgi:drug/metabolite transporter (DMT)-like permease
MPGIKANITRGYTSAVIAAVFLSTTAIFISYLTRTFQLPALVLAFWRDVFVALTLLPVLALLNRSLLRIKKGSRQYMLLYGFVLAIFNILWTLSVTTNGAAVATVLVYCSAAFTALFEWWLFKETIHWPRVVCIFFCLAGCALVSGALNPDAWNSNLAGILTGLLSGAAYAIYSLMGRSASQRGLNPWTTLLFTFAFAAGFLFLIILLPFQKVPGSTNNLQDFLWLGSAWAGWGILFLLAAVPTVAGFGLYNVSLSYLPSIVANLVVTLEPAFTVVIAYALLGERLNPVQIAGSILILSGVVLLRVSEGRQPELSPAEQVQI